MRSSSTGGRTDGTAALRDPFFRIFIGLISALAARTWKPHRGALEDATGSEYASVVRVELSPSAGKTNANSCGPRAVDRETRLDRA